MNVEVTIKQNGQEIIIVPRDEALNAVGPAYNPGGDPNIAIIKGLGASLISFLMGIKGTDHSLASRDAQLAITNLEQAVMWGVKASARRAVEDATGTQP